MATPSRASPAADRSAPVLANPRPRPLATSRPPTTIRIRPTRPVNIASIGLPGMRAQRARSRSSLRAQMTAEPAAARAIGQTIRSPNQRPTSRSSNMIPSTTSPRAKACRTDGRRTGWALAVVVRLDRDRPGQQVEDDPGAAGDGQHGEGDPDQGRVDAEPLAEPAGHAQQHPVVAAADDGRRAGRPVGDLGRRGGSPPGNACGASGPWWHAPDGPAMGVDPEHGRPGSGIGEGDPRWRPARRGRTLLPQGPIASTRSTHHVRASPRGPARGAGATRGR